MDKRGRRLPHCEMGHGFNGNNSKTFRTFQGGGILQKKNRLGLGAFLESGDYVTWNQLQATLGAGKGNDYKMISWVKNRGFPVRTKRVNKNTFKVVYLEEWWKWAEKNRDLLDFSKLEKNILGKEPDWVKVKRRHDIQRNQKYIKTPWTQSEDNRLIYLVQKQQYTYDELSRMLRRTNGAIQRRLCDLKVKDRPVKVDNHVKWTEKDLDRLENLIKTGYGYDLLAEEIGRSSKACRGKVYSTYKTENLDKVRKMMGNGRFGDKQTE